MTFQEAVDGVKIGHFVRKGGKIRGVVHVGANDGEEIPFYLALGAQKVMAFEPLAQHARLPNQFDKRVWFWPIALGDGNYSKVLNVSEGTGKGSTFLQEIDTGYQWVDRQFANVRRFDHLYIDLAPYNVLVVDVQGMELEVLKGFGKQLQAFDFLNIECSAVPLYVGEAPASAVIDYLSLQGFEQDTPIQAHDDIMFIRKGVTFPE
jgi:FkbM family methyltransferase